MRPKYTWWDKVWYYYYDGVTWIWMTILSEISGISVLSNKFFYDTLTRDSLNEHMLFDTEQEAEKDLRLKHQEYILKADTDIKNRLKHIMEDFRGINFNLVNLYSLTQTSSPK